MKRRVWLNVIVVCGLLVGLAGAGTGKAIAQVSAQGDRPIPSGQEGQPWPEGVQEAGTPLQQSLKMAIEERTALGLPVPSSVSYQYDVVTSPQQDTESAMPTEYDALGSPDHEITITSKTVLYFENPEQAGYEKWPDLVVEDNMPPNATGSVQPGDYTQIVRDRLEQEIPGIWEEYEFGHEPRTYTFEETFIITYSEQDLEALALVSSGALDSTTVEEILMGFTIAGPGIDYSIDWDFEVLGVTVIEFWAGFVLDWGLGLRLPMELGLTTPDLMIEGSSYWPSTYVEGLDWSAADFQQAGVEPEDGNEFVMRFNFGLGVFLWVWPVGNVVDIGIPPTELDESSSFETPFGPGSYFPLPSLDITIWDQDFGVAYLGLGFELQPNLGSDKVTAEWQATGDYSDTGQLTYFSPLSPVQFGPLNASDGPSQTNVRLDEFRYWFTQFLIELSAYIQLDVLDLWDGEFPIPITDIDLSELTGDLWIGIHDGTTASVMASIPVGNAPPTVQAGPDQTAYEADTVSLAPATFIDPGILDTHTATIDWGDGSVEAGTVSESSGSGTVSGSHVYADNGIYTVTVSVCDDDGGCGDDMLTITVSNVPPSVEAGPDQTIDEGETASLAPATFSDPGFDCPGCVPPTEENFTASINWGEGTVDPGTVTEIPGSQGVDTTGTVAGSHTYGDNGLFTVAVTVTDDDGGAGSDVLGVTVNNVDPTAEIDESGAIPINGIPTFLAHAGDPVGFSGRSTDPGSDDLFLSWDWDDGPPSPDVTTTYLVNPPEPDPFPSPSVQPRDETDTKSHAFADARPYSISFLAQDDDGGQGDDSSNVIIVANADQTRTAGYWLHQYRQNGRTDFDESALSDYLAIVGYMSQVFDEERDASTINHARGVLFLKRNKGSMRRIFDRQLLAAWLNFANGSIEYFEAVDTDGDGVPDAAFADAMASAEAVRLDPNATRAALEAEKDVLQRINSMDH